MKRLMIYPYDLYYEPILKNELKLLGDYKICKLVSLRSLGMIGKKVQCDNEKLVVERKLRKHIGKCRCGINC